MARELYIPAKDGYPLATTLYPGGSTTVVIGSATAVSKRFYAPLAMYLQEWGATVITFDYRGIGDSAPENLRGFEAKFSEWGLLDLAGILKWVEDSDSEKVFIVGHSAGGQLAAFADMPVDGMVTFSSQSGYWRLQGGWQKLPVLFHMSITFPLLSRLFGYMPWSLFGNAEDIPKGVALEWAGWCRDPDYIHGDDSLPLHLFKKFKAPILAFSISDDDWGTERSVRAMMRYYPNVEMRPLEVDRKLGHFGFFRPKNRDLWHGITDFLEKV